MDGVIVAIIAAVLGSTGLATVIIALLQRKWGQKDKLDKIQKDLAAHCKVDDERYMKQCRTRILRFNDEVIRGLHHTQEHFDDVLDDITSYNAYCEAHKDFKNEKAVMAIANVRRVYAECVKHNSFLIGRE